MEDITGIIITAVIAIIGWGIKAKENQKNKRSDERNTGHISMAAFNTNNAKAVIKDIVKTIGKETLDIDIFDDNDQEPLENSDLSYVIEEENDSLEIKETDDMVYEGKKSVSDEDKGSSHQVFDICKEHDSFEINLDKASLLNGIILSEILSPPKCKRR